VAEREYAWTDEGVQAARHNGLELAEVIEALYAPPGLRFERRVGETLLIVMGMASTGRVIAALCDSVEHTAKFRIVGVRALTGPDLDQWRRSIQ
jgi:hypothetical protein